MSLLLLFALTCSAVDEVQVAELVAAGAYGDALELALLVDGADGASLETWVRHQSGDLKGALESARGGLADSPRDLRLLGQAAYICGSLMLAEEALSYSEQMIELGDERGEELREHALSLIAEQESVQRSVLLSYAVIAAAAIGSLLFARSTVASPGLGEDSRTSL